MNLVQKLLLLEPLALGDLDLVRVARPDAARHEYTEGSVADISGGIGVEEAAAAAANYPLTLELATAGPVRDPRIGDVQVEIRDQRGNAVSQTAPGSVPPCVTAVGHMHARRGVEGLETEDRLNHRRQAPDYRVRVSVGR